MNITIAGGGTGGHLFPGIAIAQEFITKNSENRIVFIGSKQGIESRVLKDLQFELRTIRVKGFKGKGIRNKMDSIVSLPAGFIQSARIMRGFRTDIVIGVGGYVSFPAVMAGWAMRIPTVIHEQNSIPGLTNRILGRFASRVFTSFEHTGRFFEQHKTVLSGVPIRRQFAAEKQGYSGDRLCIFVFGGSQGSREINNAVADMLPYLADLRDGIRFIHQTGDADCALLQQQYARCGFSAQVLPFIKDMPSCYRQAHLVIARSGAATLAELALCGKASILIPYPHAADNHQEINARVFADSGAAEMIPSKQLSGERLSSLVMNLASNRERLRHMEDQAKKLAQPHAAATIVETCCQMVAHRGM